MNKYIKETGNRGKRLRKIRRYYIFFSQNSNNISIIFRIPKGLGRDYMVSNIKKTLNSKLKMSFHRLDQRNQFYILSQIMHLALFAQIPKGRLRSGRPFTTKNLSHFLRLRAKSYFVFVFVPKYYKLWASLLLSFAADFLQIPPHDRHP